MVVIMADLSTIMPGPGPASPAGPAGPAAAGPAPQLALLQSSIMFPGPRPSDTPPPPAASPSLRLAAAASASSSNPALLFPPAVRP